MSRSNNDETFIDSLTSIDDKIADLTGEVKEVRKIARDVVDVDAPQGGGREGQIEEGIPRRKRAIDLTAKVPAGGEAVEKETMPFDGFVNGIIAGWPDGADLKVGVRVVNDRRGNVYFPSGDDTFAAYNDFTDTFPVSFPIEKGEKVAAEFKSNKPSNDVPINITLKLFRKLPSESLEEISRRLS